MGKGHINFEKAENDDCEYYVSNLKRVLLGDILFSRQWRKYVFEPLSDTYFDSECLKRIVAFLEKLDGE